MSKVFGRRPCVQYLRFRSDIFATAIPAIGDKLWDTQTLTLPCMNGALGMLVRMSAPSAR
jgi:hypothetical protein